MARWVILGSVLLVAIVVSCSDDEMPPYAEDLGRDGTIPPGMTDSVPSDGGVAADGSAADGAALSTCDPVMVGDAVNQPTFDDESLAFEPASVQARFRADCVAPGRLTLVLSESDTCSAGERELVVDLPSTAAVGQTLLLGGGDDVGVTFEDSDGTRFTNLGTCALSSGSVEIVAYDTSEAGLVQEVRIDAGQLFDCSGAGRAPITVSGTVRGPLEQVFADACVGG